MTQPKRHQIKRMMPLPPAVVRVDRATMWGNPFRADRVTPEVAASGACSAAKAFDLWLSGDSNLASIEPARREAILRRIGELHGRDVACWCGPHDECHADVLMARAADAEPLPSVLHDDELDLPRIALSVRQPWAWAIVHGGKDIENRTARSVTMGGMRRVIGERIAIHAAKGMTRDEYESASATIARICGHCPKAGDLLRGGVIGTAVVSDIVSESVSPWFFGPNGLLLTEAEPSEFHGAKGELGMFLWTPNYVAPDAPAKWMQPKAAVSVRDPDLMPTLFDARG